MGNKTPSDPKTQERIAAMIEAEERYLAQRRRDEIASEAANGIARHRITSRRQFIAAASAVVSAGGMLPRLLPAAAPPGAVQRAVPADPTKVQGIPTNDDGGYGSRPPVENETRRRFAPPTKKTA